MVNTILTTLLLAAFLVRSSLTQNIHKCARPWSGTASNDPFKPLDLSILPTLPISSAGNLVRSMFKGRDVLDTNVQVDVTFGGLAASIQLESTCHQVLNDASAHGLLTGHNGATLSNGDQLEKACQIVFTPKEHFSGEVVLLYLLASGQTAAVVVQVVPCNHAPIANDDYADGMSGRVVRLNVLSNDDDQEEDQWACLDMPLVKVDASSSKEETAPKIVSFTNVAHDLGLRSDQCEVRTSPNCLFDQFDPALRKWDAGGFCMQETLTGGGCVGDVDGDGVDDIFYPRMDGHDIIYRNRGDGTFEDISADSGMSKHLHVRSNGCAFIDIDNDGDNDIYVSTVADKQFMLFVNDGTGKFFEQALKRGVANIPQNERYQGHPTAGGSIDIADYDLDGYLDIVTTEWLPQLGKERPQTKAQFNEMYNTLGNNNARVYRNLGDVKPGYFEDVTQSVGYIAYPPGQGDNDARDAMPDSRKSYNYGTKEDFREALQCIAPSTELAATAANDESIRKDLTRLQLKRKFQIVVNQIRDRQEDHLFFGIKNPMIGTYRGSGTTNASSQVHEHCFTVNLDHTWTLKDIITKKYDKTEHTIVERRGVWKEDDEEDYVGTFAEHYESITKMKGNRIVGTSSITTKKEDEYVWSRVKLFQMNSHFMKGGMANQMIGFTMMEMMSERGMEGGQDAMQNGIIHLDAPLELTGDPMEKRVKDFLGGQSPPNIPSNIPTTENQVTPPTEFETNTVSGDKDDIFRFYGSERPFKEPPFKSMLLEYDVDHSDSTGSGGQLESALMVKFACKKFKSINSTYASLKKNFQLLWNNVANANKQVREKEMLDTHMMNQEKKMIKMDEFKMDAQTKYATKAAKYNMTLQEYHEYITKREELVQFSDPVQRKKRKKGQINHFANFPMNGIFSFGAKFIDLDNDYFPDLIISGDFGTSQMLWNNRNNTFFRGFFSVIEDLMDNSMGCTVGDWDQDGKTDIMFTSVSISMKDMTALSKVSEGAGMGLTFNGNHLYKNVGDRVFEDKTDHAGVRLSGWGWGAFFFDFDNDGDLDVLNGNGMDDPETTDDDVFINQKMRLYVNKGKKDQYKLYDEAEAHGIADQNDNRGSMTFDYDGDGDLDVYVINHGDTPSLYRNDGGNYYDWLRVRVKESKALGARDSIGAKVYVTLREPSSTAKVSNMPDTIVREIKSAAAFCGQNELVAHFGLGKSNLNGGVVHQIRIVWPPIIQPRGQSNTSKLDPSTVTEAILHNVPIRQTLVVRRPPTNDHVNEGLKMVQKSIQQHVKHAVQNIDEPSIIAAWQTATKTDTLVVSHAGVSLPICTHKKITSVSSPNHGQVVIGTSGKYVKYRAFPHYSGMDSFTYTMNDGRGGTSKATVHVNVEAPPTDAHKEAMTAAAKKSKFSSLDGRGNNVEHPEKEASVFSQLLRLTPNAYSDGLENPSGGSRPSARLISNVLFTQHKGNDIGSKRGLNDMHLHFGQFLAHDISFVTPLADFYASGNFAIPVPEGDTTFDPDYTGDAVIRFRRSGGQSGTGREFGIPKQQVNKVTGWMDLSVVYGSASDRATAISSPKNGKIDMQNDGTGNGDNLAYNLKGIANLNLFGKKLERLVISGDNRVNVQPGLLTQHTLWAREHNRIVDELLVDHPTMTDRELFLTARKENIATYQHIVLYEWLPLLLGTQYIRTMKLDSYFKSGGYQGNEIDARVANEFASVAFRFGHSQVTNELKRLTTELNTSKYGHLPLRDNYFSPGRVMKQGGIDPILRGMIWTVSQEIDTKAVDGVRNFLFGTNTKGFDLVAINIQRGRDHGIPNYNALRIGLGLAEISAWEDITSDSEVIGLLKELYGDGSNGKDGFHDMDAFVGGLAEDHVEGGTIGELFAHIIGDQFFRLRNGDRHWYENTDVSGNKALLNKIKKGTEGTKGTKGTTMMDVIVRNSRLNPEDQVWDGHHTGERSAFLIPKTSMQPTRKTKKVEEHETTEL